MISRKISSLILIIFILALLIFVDRSQSFATEISLIETSQFENTVSASNTLLKKEELKLIMRNDYEQDIVLDNPYTTKPRVEYTLEDFTNFIIKSELPSQSQFSRHQFNHEQHEKIQQKNECMVTSTQDSGSGSLRQCLLEAMTNPNILFDPDVFTQSVPLTITLESLLPPITASGVSIDGSNVNIILDGQRLGERAIGLVILDTSNVTIRGLRIQNFRRYGIAISNSSNNLIGGDRSIGASSVGQGNVFVHNGLAGIAIVGNNTMSNTVQGNFIGIDNDTNIAQGGDFGIVLAGGLSNNFIGGNNENQNNIISGHAIAGIVLLGENVTNNRIQGNFIGPNQDGKSTILNSTQDGVHVGFGANNNVIGGTSSSQQNLISGNSIGIAVFGSQTRENHIQGNLVGTDEDGQKALGNDIGIQFEEGANYNVIGGDQQGVRNVISGNKVGINIKGVGTHDNQVRGNYIGTDITGMNSVCECEFGHGIQIISGANNNEIGGTTELERNIISGNTKVGIFIAEGAYENEVLGNFIGLNGLAYGLLVQAQLVTRFVAILLGLIQQEQQIMVRANIYWEMDSVFVFWMAHKII